MVQILVERLLNNRTRAMTYNCQSEGFSSHIPYLEHGSPAVQVCC